MKGNPQAQEELYDKYKKCVKSFLKSRYSQYNDIDDDVSEIMIKVFMKLTSFDNTKSKFSSWVFSIAKNHMIDKWRNNTFITSSPNSVITYTNSTTDINNKTECVTFNSIDYHFDAEIDYCSSINYISSQLSPQDFTLLDMKYVQGYDYNEIGKEFNVTSSTISNRVNYIKTKLKKNNPEIIYS